MNIVTTNKNFGTPELLISITQDSVEVLDEIYDSEDAHILGRNLADALHSVYVFLEMDKEQIEEDLREKGLI